jgi:hypothetical protein
MKFQSSIDGWIFRTQTIQGKRMNTMEMQEDFIKDKNKRIPSIFNDKSTKSFICLTFHSVLFRVFSIPLLFNSIDACIGHTCNTTRVQHDTVIPCASSYSLYYYLSSPIPSATRATTHTIV